MQEVWKPIEGYEGRYEVSNFGRVKSFAYDRQNGRMIRGSTNRDGYHTITFHDGRGNIKTILLHRLVALAFVDNPEGYREINHKDEDKDNNRAENLEWCDRQYNCNYGTKNERQSEALKCNPYTSIKVYSVDAAGQVEFFDSIGEAERQTGCSHSNIVRTLKGRSSHCGNRQWFYC